jgi:hypothetical protein
MTLDLFGKSIPEMRMSAVISDCQTYRTELRRVWDDTKPLLVVCMLNPSRADHRKNDPTVLALIHFARLWGYGGLLIINLFSYRSPSPTKMKAVSGAAFGPDNAVTIERTLSFARHAGLPILAAWGANGDHEDRAEWFCDRARKHMVDLICLGLTKDGHPKHPAARGPHRIPRDQQPIMWRPWQIGEVA